MCSGTGVIASSSICCPHSGRVNRDLFCLLNVVWHGMEALVYSSQSRAVSSYLAIIFVRIASGYPGSSTQQQSQCSTGINAGADVGRSSLK